MSRIVTQKKAKMLVRERIEKGLCPICNKKISNPQTTEFDGREIKICGQHVLRIGITPILRKERIQ